VDRIAHVECGHAAVVERGGLRDGLDVGRHFVSHHPCVRLGRVIRRAEGVIPDRLGDLVDNVDGIADDATVDRLEVVRGRPVGGIDGLITPLLSPPHAATVSYRLVAEKLRKSRSV
jgi:hypothetical protein